MKYASKMDKELINTEFTSDNGGGEATEWRSGSWDRKMKKKSCFFKFMKLFVLKLT